MMEDYESRSVTPAAGFFILLGLLGAGLIIGSLAGFAVWAAMTGKGIFTLEKDMQNPQFTNAARVMQMVSVLFMFFLPAVFTARIMNRRPFKWLGYTGRFNMKQILLVVIIMAACLPMVGALGELNQAIPLSKGLEKIVRKMEDNYNMQAEALATMRSFSEYIFSLIVMALLPAVFEETFFRGGMQRLLVGWFKHPAVAIIVTSLLFSAMHISWFGFLPRFALGMVLGWLFYYSGSIWINMLAHFLNNALAVTYMYYLTSHNKPVKEAMEDSAPLWMGIPALILVILLVRVFRNASPRDNGDGAARTSDAAFDPNLLH